MITSPTRTPSQSCLDLILAPVHLPKDCKVISSSLTSLDGLTDHHFVGISMALPLHRSPRNKHVHKYRSPPLHKADFQGLLGHIPVHFKPQTYRVYPWMRPRLFDKEVYWLDLMLSAQKCKIAPQTNPALPLG